MSPDLDSLSDDDDSTFNNILKTIDYKNYKSRGGAKKSKRFQIINHKHLHKIKEIEDGASVLHGEGRKTIIPAILLILGLD